MWKFRLIGGHIGPLAALCCLFLVGNPSKQAIAQVLGGKRAKSPPPVESVPEDLKSSPAYSLYAQMIIEIELLANPATASLPIDASSSQPGQIHLAGQVGSTRVRQQIIAAARRISGLKIVDEMRSGEAPRELSAMPKAQLESLTAETIESLFPELASKVRVTAAQDGVIVLNGSVPSFEQKLQLSQCVKSQPGCKAVQNQLQVDIDPKSGELLVSADGQMKLKANRLPPVPPAPLGDLNSIDAQLSVRDLTSRRGVADDAPDGEFFDRQIREDVRHQIEADAELAGVEVQVESSGGVVTLTAQLKNRGQVERLVETASLAPGVRKIVAKCTPYSMQRSIVSRPTGRKTQEPAKTSAKLLGFLPWARSVDSVEDPNAANTRNFRDGVRRALKRRCEGRFEKIAVNNTLHGLLIEGEVSNVRDRTFVLKQIDNTVELRGLNYDVAIRMKDAK